MGAVVGRLDNALISSDYDFVKLPITLAVVFFNPDSSLSVVN